MWSSSSTATRCWSRRTTSTASWKNSTRAPASPAPAARCCRCATATAAPCSIPMRCKKFLGSHPEATIYPKVGWFHHLQRGITDMYRDVLYYFLQKFVYVGPDDLLRQHPQSGGLRRRLSPQRAEDHRVRPLRADPGRRSHQLGRHLHRLRDERQRLPQHPAHRRLRPLAGAGSRPRAGTDLPVVLVLPAKLLLLRRTDAQPVQGVQALPPEEERSRPNWQPDSRTSASITSSTASPSASTPPSSTADPSAGCCSCRHSRKWRFRPRC